VGLLLQLLLEHACSSINGLINTVVIHEIL
jgi:hypothetical protein